MLNYLKKFAMDILPSVAATVIGAYVVNHYIIAKPAADAPAATASVQAKKVEPKSNAKPAEAEVASIPEPGVKARGISERAMIEKLAAERPAEAKPAKAEAAAKSAEAKAAEKKPVETASLPEMQRHPASPVREKEKAVDKAPAEAAKVPSEDRAAELAREAIERLRAKDAAAARVEEAARAPESPRPQDVPHVVAAAPVRPLPPPINVATPQVTAYGTYAPVGNSQAGPGQIPGQGSSPPSTASIANNDPDRPIPPADIPQPTPPSIDLQKGANDAVARTTTVAHDMLSAAKSMFQAVLPGGQKLSDPANQNFTD